MTRHILLLCLLGNPFELNLGGHQRTVSEIINHFKDTPQLELTVITTNCSLKELTANHLCSNITIYEIPIKKQWLENQDLLYNNKDFLYKTIKNIYEINFSGERSTLNTRKEKNYNEYYDKIWRDLDVRVS